MTCHLAVPNQTRERHGQEFGDPNGPRVCGVEPCGSQEVDSR